jgi:hypothetical protein
MRETLPECVLTRAVSPESPPTSGKNEQRGVRTPLSSSCASARVGLAISGRSPRLDVDVRIDRAQSLPGSLEVTACEQSHKRSVV